MNNQILVQPKILDDKIVLEIPRKILEGILVLSKEKKQSIARSYLKQYRGILSHGIASPRRVRRGSQ